ncbi:hypothetical protein ANANG_G00002030 [Anguilla anguilla]|uniref:Uncharacterized protein n=1 Tax=Anguilla anguilla TaxID=7936 RepID=A0A9D3S5V5_ANGAN|nr:hypothetical protein ANANG_G00002030 [Anguilla anguilla]
MFQSPEKGGAVSKTALSELPDPKAGSLDPNRNKNECRVQVERAGSPVPSCISMKSDSSMDPRWNFRGESTDDSSLLPLASPCGEQGSSAVCKSSPASTQPLLHQDSCRASSWPHTVTGRLATPGQSAGDLRAAVVPRGLMRRPTCSGHALAVTNHCPAALWVSLGRQRVEEHTLREQQHDWQRMTGGPPKDWSSGSLLQLWKGPGRPGFPLATGFHPLAVKKLCWDMRTPNGTLNNLFAQVYTSASVRPDLRVVITTLLYSCEAWTLYSRHLRMLEAFLIRCVQCILRMEATITQHQLRWLGHFIGMPKERLPRKVLLHLGRRSAEGQKKAI